MFLYSSPGLFGSIHSDESFGFVEILWNRDGLENETQCALNNRYTAVITRAE